MDILGPFEVLKHPLTMLAQDIKPPVTGGPVAWWKFDESDGSEVADASGNHHPAQIRGVPQWEPGPSGNALALDGVNNYVDCGESPELDFHNALTVSLWMKSGQADDSKQTLAAKGTDAWRIQTDGENGNLSFYLGGPTTAAKDSRRTTQATSKRKVADGQWHHVAAVYDGKRMALYLDGDLEDSIEASGPVVLNTEPVWLGNNSAARGDYFNGLLEDVRLYNRGLTEDEIKALQSAKAN